MPPEPLARFVKRLEAFPLGYEPAQGISELCDIARIHFNVPGDYAVIVTAGASMAMTIALTAICKPDDVVLLPQVGYPGTQAAVKALSLIPRYYQFVNGELKIIGDEPIASAITIFNSPNNPTGKIANTTEIDSILKYCALNGSILISDEVYRDLIYDGHFESPVDRPTTATIFQVQSLSKSCAMSGLRIGFLIVPKDWETRLLKIHRALAMCASIPSQLLAYELFNWNGFQSWQLNQLECMRERRNYCAEILHEPGLNFEIPAAGPFLWLDVGGLRVNGDTFTEALSRCMNVLLASGSQFTTDPSSHVRFCFGSGNEKELREAATKVVEMSKILSPIALSRTRSV